MKLSSATKLFMGLRVDAAMKRQIDEGNTRGKPVFKAGDPAHLEIIREGEDLYIGRIVDAGLSVDDIGDLQRNIRSILSLTFPEQKRSAASLRIFAVDQEEALAATG